jgi:hypothetical protein
MNKIMDRRQQQPQQPDRPFRRRSRSLTAGDEFWTLPSSSPSPYDDHRGDDDDDHDDHDDDGIVYEDLKGYDHRAMEVVGGGGSTRRRRPTTTYPPLFTGTSSASHHSVAAPPPPPSSYPPRRSWLLSFALPGGSGGGKASSSSDLLLLRRSFDDDDDDGGELGECDCDSLPGMIMESTSECDDSSSESSSSSDDRSLSSVLSRGGGGGGIIRGVTFAPSVRIRPIPHHEQLTDVQRRRMYSSSLEVRKNKVRGKKEYRYDGCDWRNATEEWEMGVDMVTGELVHPAHEYGMVA